MPTNILAVPALPMRQSSPSFSAFKGYLHGNLVNIESEEALNELLSESKKPVLINFQADWCSACKKQEKVLSALPKPIMSRFTLASVDIKELPGLAQKYNIYSIPTSVLYSNGKFIKRQDGLLSAYELAQWLN